MPDQGYMGGMRDLDDVERENELRDQGYMDAAAVPVPDAGDDGLREPDPNDAIQSLARIAAAASRLMAQMHRLGQTRDRDEEIQHMRANLDHVEAQVQSWWRGGQS